MRHTAVLKLGGSLLDLADWPARMTGFLVQSQYRPMLVVGGGLAADRVRSWQVAHKFDDRTAHQLALHAMRFNSVAAAQIIGGRLVSTMSDVEACWRDDTIPVIDVVRFLDDTKSRDVSSESHLPPNWNATSDSIAAFIAGWCQVDRLVLFKSVDLPNKTTDATDDFLEIAAQHNMVDPLIAGITRHFAMQVEWKNLRSP